MTLLFLFSHFLKFGKITERLALFYFSRIFHFFGFCLMNLEFFQINQEFCYFLESAWIFFFSKFLFVWNFQKKLRKILSWSSKLQIVFSQKRNRNSRFLHNFSIIRIISQKLSNKKGEGFFLRKFIKKNFTKNFLSRIFPENMLFRKEKILIKRKYYINVFEIRNKES